MMQSDFNLTTYQEDIKETSLNWTSSVKSYCMFSGAKTLVMISSWDAYSSGSDDEGDWKQYHIHGRVGTGTGHIRLRLRHKKHTGGNWINRDPAAVADTTSGNVRAIWCEDGYIIAYDPGWIFTDLYSS